MRRRAILTLTACSALACSGDGAPASESGDTGETGASGPPDFGEVGPLVGDDGRGSFRFGAASAAAQIEDMNENTDWYWFTLPISQGGAGRHTPVGDASRGFSMADVDVGLIADLGLDSYRFSMSWARIEPTRDVIDEAALQHYSDFIDALIAAGVRPMITVHHFSNPVWIDDPRDLDCAAGPTDANLCGFGHPTGGAMVVEEMGEHARLLAERFGDRVDDWATVNEPINYMMAGHGVGIFPPGKTGIFDFENDLMPAIKDYMLGHAAAYHAIKDADTIDADDDGSPADVGMTLNVVEWVPARDNALSDDPADVAARDRIHYAYSYWLPEALRTGGWDADFDGTADEQIPELAGTLDWMGVQYYLRSGVTGDPGIVPLLAATPCFGDIDLGSCVPALDETYCVPTMHYEYNPDGLSTILEDFTNRWPDLPLVISEGGIATTTGERRAENIVRTLEQVEAINDAGGDVRGYYYWSLTDNFEWAEGFKPRFGLFRVNYQTYDRTPTLGADVYAEIVAERRLRDEFRQTYGGSGPLTPDPAHGGGLQCGPTMP